MKKIQILENLENYLWNYWWVLVIVIVGLFLWANWLKTYKVDLKGRFDECVKRLSVERGVLLVEVPPSVAFQIREKDSSSYRLLKPWGEEVFVAMEYRGKTYSVAGPRTFLPVPVGGEVVLRLRHRQSFDPLLHRIWSGRIKGDNFQRSPIKIKIHFLKGGDKIPAGAKMAVVVTMKKKKVRAEAKNESGNGIFSQVKRALGYLPERPEYKEIPKIIFFKEVSND